MIDREKLFAKVKDLPPWSGDLYSLAALFQEQLTHEELVVLRDYLREFAEIVECVVEFERQRILP